MPRCGDAGGKTKAGKPCGWSTGLCKHSRCKHHCDEGCFAPARCRGTTKAGLPCRQTDGLRSGYCFQHLGQRNDREGSPAPPEDPTKLVPDALALLETGVEGEAPRGGSVFLARKVLFDFERVKFVDKELKVGFTGRDVDVRLAEVQEAQNEGMQDGDTNYYIVSPRLSITGLMEPKLVEQMVLTQMEAYRTQPDFKSGSTELLTCEDAVAFAVLGAVLRTCTERRWGKIKFGFSCGSLGLAGLEHLPAFCAAAGMPVPAKARLMPHAAVIAQFVDPFEYRFSCRQAPALIYAMHLSSW